MLHIKVKIDGTVDQREQLSFKDNNKRVVALGQSKTSALSKFHLPVSNYADTVYTLMQLRIENILPTAVSKTVNKILSSKFFLRSKLLLFTFAFNLQEEKEREPVKHFRHSYCLSGVHHTKR